MRLKSWALVRAQNLSRSADLVNDGDKNGWINDDNTCGLKKYFLREIEFNG